MLSPGAQWPKNHELWCLKPGENWYQEEREGICPLFTFCTVWALNELDDGGSSLFRQLNQMPVYFRNPLTLQSNVLSAVWAFLSPVKLTHQINHHADLLESKILVDKSYCVTVTQCQLMYKMSNQAYKGQFNPACVMYKICLINMQK